MMFGNILDVLPYVNTGKLRAIVSAGANRSPLMPDVPTLAEAGISNAESFAWFALVVPKGTPREIIATLNSEIVKAEKQPEVRQRLFEFGVDPIGNSPEEADALIRSEIAKWAKVIKDSGAKVDD